MGSESLGVWRSYGKSKSGVWGLRRILLVPLGDPISSPNTWLMGTWSQLKCKWIKSFKAIRSHLTRVEIESSLLLDQGLGHLNDTVYWGIDKYVNLQQMALYNISSI